LFPWFYSLLDTLPTINAMGVRKPLVDEKYSVIRKSRNIIVAGSIVAAPAGMSALFGRQAFGATIDTFCRLVVAKNMSSAMPFWHSRISTK
jgi:hypothetical protein